MRLTDKKYIVLIGHPGAGKTTAMIKMAAWEWKYDKNIAVASMDNIEMIGIEKAKRFAEKMGYDFIEIKDGKELLKLKMCDCHDHVYIAGAGISAGDFDELHRVINILKEIEDEYEVYLVLSSTTANNYIKKYIEFIKSIKINGIILTHMDETGDYRINEVEEISGLEVSYLSIGNRVPVDFVERSEYEKKSSLDTASL